MNGIFTTMDTKTFGRTIAELRKAKGMTQAELADKLGITDKAVSKWERDLSYPDTSLLPQLAAIFGVSVDELMRYEGVAVKKEGNGKTGELIRLIMRAIALAMGVATATTAVLDKIEIRPAMIMLGMGLACLAITSFMDDENGE